MVFANLSGGRDSSCMVVKWLESGYDIDYIIFCDTGLEFKEMLEYIDNLNRYLSKNFNKEITRIDSSGIIEKWAFEYPIQKGIRKGRLRGLPMQIGKDYCTREAKIYATRNFCISKCSNNKFKNEILIGYTYNEVERRRNSNVDYAISRYPLHEWGMNEIDVDIFLKKRGIHNKLYNHFKRTGCYNCPKQSKKSLYNLYKYYPALFEKMIEWEQRAVSLDCVNQRFFMEKSMLDFKKEFDNMQNNALFESEYIGEKDSCFCFV